MLVTELIKKLSHLPLSTKIVIASDEELNTIYDRFQVASLTDQGNTAVIYGLSGSEQDL